ncbi:MAG: hypothetical protein P1U56_26215, partial [Saprospiraceae bacterium]|nr:hypothetical protein [Saprospiraceae bacterium]
MGLHTSAKNISKSSTHISSLYPDQYIELTYSKLSTFLWGRVQIFTLVLCTAFSLSLLATDVTIENIRVVNRDDVLQTPISVIFDLKWENAWNNAKNHDAIWVFVKFGTAYDNHAKLNSTGHKVLQNRISSAPNPIIEVDKNGIGCLIYPSTTYRGNQNFKLQIVLDTTSQKINYSKLNGLSVHAIEMVYIPKGDFTLGSPDAAAIKRASLYQSDSEGNPNGLITISSEAAIAVEAKEGAMYYWSEETLYNGDQKGPIPAEFPKGHDAF